MHDDEFPSSGDIGLSTLMALQPKKVPCLVCQWPCETSENKLIPSLPFCVACKKLYFTRLEKWRKNHSHRGSIDLLNEPRCPSGGHCIIDYRHSCPEQWCSLCHLRKFQTILKKFDSLHVTTHGAQKHKKSQCVKKFPDLNPIVLIKKLTENDLAKYGIQMQTDRCLSIGSNHPHGSSYPNKRKADTLDDKQKIKKSKLPYMSSKKLKNSPLTNARRHSIKVYVFTCGHACSVCNTPEAKQWLKETGYNTAPPAVEDILPPLHSSCNVIETTYDPNGKLPQYKPSNKLSSSSYAHDPVKVADNTNSISFIPRIKSTTADRDINIGSSNTPTSKSMYGLLWGTMNAPHQKMSTSNSVQGITSLYQNIANVSNGNESHSMNVPNQTTAVNEDQSSSSIFSHKVTRPTTNMTLTISNLPPHQTMAGSSRSRTLQTITVNDLSCKSVNVLNKTSTISRIAPQIETKAVPSIKSKPQGITGLFLNPVNNPETARSQLYNVTPQNSKTKIILRHCSSSLNSRPKSMNSAQDHALPILILPPAKDSRRDCASSSLSQTSIGSSLGTPLQTNGPTQEKSTFLTSSTQANIDTKTAHATHLMHTLINAHNEKTTLSSTQIITTPSTSSQIITTAITSTVSAFPYSKSVPSVCQTSVNPQSHTKAIVKNVVTSSHLTDDGTSIPPAAKTITLWSQSVKVNGATHQLMIPLSLQEGVQQSPSPVAVISESQ